MAAGKSTKAKGRIKKERVQIKADELPRLPLVDVIPIAKVLHTTYAGKPTSWDDIASTIESGAKTNSFKYKMWAAQAYGIIKKEDNDLFSLAETGRKIVAPMYEQEDMEGRKKAVLTPTLLSRFYSDYDDHPIPAPAHFSNVLESKYNVPRERTSAAIETIEKNAQYAGILEKVEGDGQPIIKLGGAIHSQLIPISQEQSDIEVSKQPSTSNRSEPPAERIDWTKICFYITPIGDEGTETRKHADMMLKHLVEPIMKQFGLAVVRADRIEKSGLITQQIFEHLVRAGLCVADLSFSNPNAFYELGVRHMCKLPTIQIIRKGDKIPFDVSQGRTIVVDTSDVYTVMDRFESAKRELVEHVRYIQTATDNETGEDNPVSYYLPTIKVSLPN